jgi:uncharacterized sulfatase
MERVIGTAEMASSLDPEATPALTKALSDPDSAVRYWAASGILMRGAKAFEPAAAALRKALSDSGPYVRAVAAEALARYGTADDLSKALAVLENLVPADKNGAYVSLWALITIDDLGEKAKPIWPKIKDFSVQDAKAAQRAQGYPARLMDKLKAGM